jgi:uncharacterized protein
MVHTYKMNGCNVAVDGNSGSIHLLDDLCYRMLDKVQELAPLQEVTERLRAHHMQYSDEEIEDAYRQLLSLQEEGLLFTSSRRIEETIGAKKKSNSLKALCLHVAHDCNLRCEYCFASKGDYNSGRGLMPKETALRAVDYLVENSGSRRNIEIDFFGGEPLMNLDVVRETVAYGRMMEKKTGKRFYFTLTTNGTLLNDRNIEFINEQMDNVVISIDGRKEIHDRLRYDRSGRGTYSRIVPLARRLVSGRNGRSYFIRGTFTSKNKDFSKDVLHLAGLGFKEISVEPVVGSGNELFLNDGDVPEICDEYERLAVEYLNRLRKGEELRFYHFNMDIYDGPCIYKRVTACGAGFEYLAVSPEGRLYPCHQFVGQKEFIIGDIWGGVGNIELQDSFKECDILTKEKCRDCWAKLFCCGGCHANAWYTNGNIYEPNEIACMLQKKRIECAIMVQASLLEDAEQ